MIGFLLGSWPTRLITIVAIPVFIFHEHGILWLLFIFNVYFWPLAWINYDYLARDEKLLNQFWIAEQEKNSKGV